MATVDEQISMVWFCNSIRAVITNLHRITSDIYVRYCARFYRMATMICKRGCRSGIKAQVLVNDWDGTLLCPQCGYEDYTETHDTPVTAEVAAYIRRVPKYTREEWDV